MHSYVYLHRYTQIRGGGEGDIYGANRFNEEFQKEVKMDTSSLFRDIGQHLVVHSLTRLCPSFTVMVQIKAQLTRRPPCLPSRDRERSMDSKSPMHIIRAKVVFIKAFEFEETCPTEPDQTLVVSSP